MEIRKRISCKLLETRGDTMLGAGILIMVIVFFIGASMEYVRVLNVLDGLTDTVNEAVVSVAAVNCPNVYGGVREGEGLARSYTASEWERNVSTDEVTDMLSRVLILSETADGFTRAARGKELYSMKNFTVSYLNDDGGVLQFESRFTVSIPIYFAGQILPPVQKEMKVKSTYEPKF